MKTLNLLLIFSSLIFLSSCSSEISTKEAKQTAEHYFKLLNEKNYTAAVELSASELISGGNKEQSLKKMKTLDEKLGPVLSYALKEEKVNKEFAQRTNIELHYEVKHKNLSTLEIFMIVKEMGDYKIYNHTITNLDF